MPCMQNENNNNLSFEKTIPNITNWVLNLIYRFHYKEKGRYIYYVLQIHVE